MGTRPSERLSTRNVETLKDAIATTESNPEDRERFSSLMWANNGEAYDAAGRKQVLAYLGLPDAPLRSYARALERTSGKFDRNSVAALLAHVDAAGRYRPRTHNTLVGLLDACTFDQDARALLTERIGGVSDLTIVKNILDEVRAAGVLTREAWEEDLAPALRRTPFTSSPSADLMLGARCDSAVKIDPQIVASVDRFLWSRGYPLEANRHDDAESVRARHLAANDPEFSRALDGTGLVPVPVKLAVIDHEFDPKHPLFEGKLEAPAPDRAGRDGWIHWCGKPKLERIDLSHGNHVAGIALYGSALLRGVLVAKPSVELPARLASLHSFEPTDALPRALEASAAAGATIIDISAGYYGEENVAAMRAFLDAHPEVVVIMAAGNRGRSLDALGLKPDNYVAAMGPIRS
jgi:hypothetical protein